VPVCGTIRFVGILPPSCVRSESALPLRSPCAVPLPSQVLGQPGLAQQGVFVRLSVRSERNESAIRIAPNVPIMRGRISRNGYGGGYSGMSSAQFFVDGPGCQRLAVRSALFIVCCSLFPSAMGLCRGIDGWREGRQRIRKETVARAWSQICKVLDEDMTLLQGIGGRGSVPTLGTGRGAGARNRLTAPCRAHAASAARSRLRSSARKLRRAWRAALAWQPEEPRSCRSSPCPRRETSRNTLAPLALS
jgi:hypothetical protein